MPLGESQPLESLGELVPYFCYSIDTLSHHTWNYTLILSLTNWELSKESQKIRITRRRWCRRCCIRWSPYISFDAHQADVDKHYNYHHKQGCTNTPNDGSQSLLSWFVNMSWWQSPKCRKTTIPINWCCYPQNSCFMWLCLWLNWFVWEMQLWSKRWRVDFSSLWRQRTGFYEPAIWSNLRDIGRPELEIKGGQKKKPSIIFVITTLN